MCKLFCFVSGSFVDPGIVNALEFVLNSGVGPLIRFILNSASARRERERTAQENTPHNCAATIPRINCMPYLSAHPTPSMLHTEHLQQQQQRRAPAVLKCV